MPSPSITRLRELARGYGMSEGHIGAIFRTDRDVAQVTAESHDGWGIAYSEYANPRMLFGIQYVLHDRSPGPGYAYFEVLDHSDNSRAFIEAGNVDKRKELALLYYGLSGYTIDDMPSVQWPSVPRALYSKQTPEVIHRLARFLASLEELRTHNAVL